MARDPLDEKVEVEIICPSCGYRATRTAARLRRETLVMCPECGAEIVRGQDEDEDGKNMPD